MGNKTSKIELLDDMDVDVLEPSPQDIIGVTDEQISLFAPSALRSELSDDERLNLGRSKRYVFVSSQEVKSYMQSLGWVQIKVKSPKSKIHPDTCQHTMIFRNPGLELSKRLEVGGLRPEILITNSHNGQTAFKFHLGFFRLVCENGLVVADKTIENFRVRHFNIDFDTIKMYISNVTFRLPEIIKNIDTYKRIKMNKSQQSDFALRAMLLRNDKQIDKLTGRLNMSKFRSIYHPDELLAVQRGADDSNDLFTVFNRVQENLIKGNYKHHTEKSRRPHPLVENRKLMIVNKELWSLMDTYAQSLS